MNGACLDRMNDARWFTKNAMKLIIKIYEKGKFYYNINIIIITFLIKRRFFFRTTCETICIFIKPPWPQADKKKLKIKRFLWDDRVYVWDACAINIQITFFRDSRGGGLQVGRLKGLHAHTHYTPVSFPSLFRSPRPHAYMEYT